MLKRLFLLILLCGAVFLLISLMASGGNEEMLALPEKPSPTIMMPIKSAIEARESAGKPVLILLSVTGFLLLFTAQPGLTQRILWPRAPHAQVCYYAFHFSDRAG